MHVLGLSYCLALCDLSSNEIFFLHFKQLRHRSTPTKRIAWKWQHHFTSASSSARTNQPTTTRLAITIVPHVTLLHPRIDYGSIKKNPAKYLFLFILDSLILIYILFLFQGLISLLEDRDNEISDLKDYIDSLLLRVIDTCPTVLQTPVKAKQRKWWSVRPWMKITTIW